MLKLLIARHGNTFDSGDTILRVGLRTDLPLSHSGQEQAESLAHFIADNYPTIDQIYCSELQRTEQTARFIQNNYPNKTPDIEVRSFLNEIDYGIDDGQPESKVVERLGRQALNDWENTTILPKGWLFDIDKTIEAIRVFADDLVASNNQKTILVVTSNGVARFFTQLLNENARHTLEGKLKLPTASLSELQYDDIEGWKCLFWGKKI